MNTQEKLLAALNDVMVTQSAKNIGKPYPDGAIESLDQLILGVNEAVAETGATAFPVYAVYGVGRHSCRSELILVSPVIVQVNEKGDPQILTLTWHYNDPLLEYAASFNLLPEERYNDNYLFFSIEKADAYLEWAKEHTLTSDQKNPQIHALFRDMEREFDLLDEYQPRYEDFGDFE